MGRANPIAALPAICLLALTLAGCGPQSGKWQVLRIGSGAHVLTLAADPFSAGRVYAGADNGVVYITNADQSGVPVASQGIPSSARISALYPDPSHAGSLLAGTSKGLYRSQDYGQHWSLDDQGLPTEQITALGGVGAVALAAANGTGVFVSHDDGATWEYANRGLPAATINALTCVTARACFAALDSATAFGAAGVYMTTDGGAAWQVAATGLPSGPVYALTAIPDHGLSPSAYRLLVGTTRGVYASVDNGASWRASNIDMPTAAVRALGRSPTSPDLLYAGVGSSAYTSTDGGLHWGLVAQTGLGAVGASMVTGVVGVRGARTGVVVFAAAGLFARTPPTPGGSNLIPSIIATLIFLALVPLIIYRIRTEIRRRVRARRPTGGADDGVGALPIRINRSVPARAPTPRGGRAKPTFTAESATPQHTIAGRIPSSSTTPETPAMPPTTARPAPGATAQHNGHSKPKPPTSDDA